MTKHLVRWIDRHLIAISIVMLAIGFCGTMVSAVRADVPLYIDVVGSIAKGVSPLGVALYVLIALASPLSYNSVLLLVAGIIVRRGRATLIGFENTEGAELIVEGAGFRPHDLAWKTVPQRIRRANCSYCPNQAPFSR